MEAEARWEKEPTKETAEEREREALLLEVSEAVLRENGWKLYKSDRNVFSVLVRQGVDVKKALSEGSGVFASHFLRNSQGYVSGGGHIDQLHKGKTLQGEEVMETGYDSSVGQYGLIVLERI